MLYLFSISEAGLDKGHIFMSSESTFFFLAQWLSDTVCENSLQAHASKITSFCQVKDVLVGSLVVFKYR